MCLVLFLPVQSLLTCFRSFLTLRILSLTNILPHSSKAFLCFTGFSGSPTSVHRPLHAPQYYTVDIPFWTTRSQRLSLTEKPQYHMLKILDHTIPLRLHTCYGEVYRNIACEENGWHISYNTVTVSIAESDSSAAASARWPAIEKKWIQRCT